MLDLGGKIGGRKTAARRPVGRRPRRTEPRLACERTPQRRPPRQPPDEVRGRLERGVAQRRPVGAIIAQQVGEATGRAAFASRRGEHHRRVAVAQPQVGALDRSGERAVFGKRHERASADPVVGGAGQREARTPRPEVTGPRIVRPGVDQVGELRVEFGQSPFERADRKRRQRGERRRVEGDDARDRVGAPQLGEVGGDPVRVDAAVGVGRHHDTVGREHRRCPVHRRPPGTAGVRLGRRQHRFDDDDADIACRELSRNARGRIAAVVDQHDDGDRPRHERRGGVERGKAGGDALRLVARGNGDRDRPGGRGIEPSLHDRARHPHGWRNDRSA